MERARLVDFSNKHAALLFDVGLYIRERAFEAKAARDLAVRNSDEFTFQAGRTMAFGEVIAILQQTLQGFDIPLSDMQLDNLDTDNDL